MPQTATVASVVLLSQWLELGVEELAWSQLCNAWQRFLTRVSARLCVQERYRWLSSSRYLLRSNNGISGRVSKLEASRKKYRLSKSTISTVLKAEDALKNSDFFGNFLLFSTCWSRYNYSRLYNFLFFFFQYYWKLIALCIYTGFFFLDGTDFWIKVLWPSRSCHLLIWTLYRGRNAITCHGLQFSHINNCIQVNN